MPVKLKILVDDDGTVSIKNLGKELDKTGKKAAKAESKFTKLGKSFKANILQITAFTAAIAGTARVLKKTITAASDLVESQNAVNVVFKDGAKEILNFGKSASKSVALANAEFNQLASVTGALIMDVGKPMTEVAKITTDLTIRAADMASVMNTTVQDALSAINQAIRGETEAIRRYTGDVTDQTLQQFALANGIKKTVTTMTQQEKKLLRLRVIMKQTEKFAGDFARTNKEFANQTRILWAQINDLAASLGEKLLPALTDGINAANDFIDKNGSKIVDFFEKLQKIGESTRKFTVFGMLFGDDPMAGMKPLKEYDAFMARMIEQAKKNKLSPEAAGLVPSKPKAKSAAIIPFKRAEIARRELDIINKQNISLKDKILLSHQYNNISAESVLASERIFSITNGIGQSLVTATMHAESLSDALKKVANQLLARGMMGLLGAGIGGFLGGVGGAKAGFNIGFGDKLFKTKAAGGANFTVPGGYPNDSYPMLVSSGEHVQVTPKGGGGSSSGVNINLSLTVGGGNRQAIQASANKHLSNLAEDVKAIIKNRNLRKTDLAKAV